jgi:hypothetical protein
MKQANVSIKDSCYKSPTLFNMYINDTPQAIGDHLALFADDTCLYATEHKEGYVIRKLQHGINSVAEWSKRWNIKIRRRRSTSLIELDRLSLFLH